MLRLCTLNVLLFRWKVGAVCWPAHCTRPSLQYSSSSGSSGSGNLQEIARILNDFSSAAADPSHRVSDADIGPRLIRPLTVLSLTHPPTQMAPTAWVPRTLLASWRQAAQVAITLVIRSLTPVASATLPRYAAEHKEALPKETWARFALLCAVIADISRPLCGGNSLLATAAARCTSLCCGSGGLSSHHPRRVRVACQ